MAAKDREALIAELQKNMRDKTLVEKVIVEFGEKYHVKEFNRRQEANALVHDCFRNTILEEYHGDGYITDIEMKNTMIEASARLEYLLSSNGFEEIKPERIWDDVLQVSYANNVERKLSKAKQVALKKESLTGLLNMQSYKVDLPFLYKARMLAARVSIYYWNEDIKFDGKKLTGDPNKVSVDSAYTVKSPYFQSL